MKASNLKSYPDTKDSGGKWLGRVPSHWKIERFKYLLREEHARSTSGTEQLLRVSQYTGITKRKPHSGGRLENTRAESLIGYRIVCPGDLVVNIMLAWNGSLGVSPVNGIVSPAYCVYRFRACTEPRYVHYLLRSPSYRARVKAASTGVVESRLRLYTDDLYRLEALSPPLHEQRAIVRFLDHADRRIRRYIRAKENLIALLAEQKQALIHQAVTGQIDVRTGQPYPAYQDSGVEWLAKVPKHWQRRAVGQLFQIGRGKVTSHEYITGHPGPFPLYSSQTENDGVMGYIDTFMFDGDYLTWTTDGAHAGTVFQRTKRFSCTNVCGTLCPKTHKGTSICCPPCDFDCKLSASEVVRWSGGLVE